jgi:hypothetical protein
MTTKAGVGYRYFPTADPISWQRTDSRPGYPNQHDATWERENGKYGGGWTADRQGRGGVGQGRLAGGARGMGGGFIGGGGPTLGDVPTVTRPSSQRQQKEVAAAEKEVAAAEKEVAAAEKEVAAAEKEVAAAEKEVAAAEKEVAAAEKEVAAAEKEVAAAEKDVPPMAKGKEVVRGQGGVGSGSGEGGRWRVPSLAEGPGRGANRGANDNGWQTREQKQAFLTTYFQTGQGPSGRTTPWGDREEGEEGVPPLPTTGNAQTLEHAG